MSEHIETHCPRCDAALHVTNFTASSSKDETTLLLRIDCWRCTWSTEFRIESFNGEPE